MLGEDSRFDVGGAASGKIDHEVECLPLVKGRFLRGHSQGLKSAKQEQACCKSCQSTIFSPHLILLSTQRLCTMVVGSGRPPVAPTTPGEDRGLMMDDGTNKARSSILDPPFSTQSLSAWIQRVHHQSFVMPGRAEILVECMREHAVRHHRVAIVSARTGPDHVGVVGGLKVAVAG